MEEPSLVEVFGSYMAYRITADTFVISFMNGTEYMYLLEGQTRALLIDTGWGAGNLRAFVTGLTDLPVVVANTHYHPDHAGGNGEFEEVLMSSGSETDRFAVGKPGLTPFDTSKLPHPDYKHTFVGTGDEIDLGGRVIEVYNARDAHCFSSLFFFDRANGLFFCGDEFEAGQVNLFDNSCNPDSPYDARTCVNNFTANAQFIKSLAPAITYLLPNHNGTPIALSYIDDFLSLASEIISGTAVPLSDLKNRYIAADPKAPSLCRVEHGSAAVIMKRSDVEGFAKD